MNEKKILDFWFSSETQPLWFEKSAQFDEKIKQQFGDIHQKACQGELWSWRTTIHGRLAEIIILDQFSRNIFRDTSLAFASDGMALILAQEAIQLQWDIQLDIVQRKFLYMPFMHSESQVIHQQAITLFERLNDPLTLDFEHRHKKIVDKFGRYPHRNHILNRASTQEEIAFLKQPNSGF